MTKTFLICAGAAMLLAASPAAAEDWRLIHRNDRGEDYVDADRITREGDRVRFWHQLRYSEPQRDVGGGYDRFTVNIRASCSDRSYRIVRMIASMGEAEGEGFSPRQDYDPPPEGSIMWEMIGMVCSGNLGMIGEPPAPPST